MPATVKVDASGLTRMLQGLARFTPEGVKHVVRAEAGSILKTAAGRTKVAAPAQADRRAILRALRGLGFTKAALPGDITINAGVRGQFGRVWVRSSEPRRGTGRPYRLAGVIPSPQGGFRPMAYRWRRGVWIDILEALADAIRFIGKETAVGRRAVGLARQSFVQIADAIGIRLEAVPGGGLSAAGIAKARAALASDGRAYVNGTGREFGDAQTFFIEMQNRLPYGGAIRLDAVLGGAINGRVKFFDRNLQEGVFRNVGSMVRAYPGITFSRN